MPSIMRYESKPMFQGRGRDKKICWRRWFRQVEQGRTNDSETSCDLVINIQDDQVGQKLLNRNSVLRWRA